MESLSENALPREENERIFQERIIPQLESSDAAAHSRAWLVGGQPGAGKSSLVGKNSSSERGIQVGTDLFRREHPYWLQCLTEDHETATSRTSADAKIWVARSVDWLIAKHRNIVVDGTLRDPQYAENLVSTLKAAEYHVKVHFVATQPAVSLMSVVERYWENFKQTGLPFRMCRRPLYESGCGGVLVTAERMDRREIAVDALHVYCRRTRQEIYPHDTPISHSTGGAADAIRVEQGRTWSHEEAEVFLDKYLTLRSSLVGGDGKWHQWFDDIARLAQPVLPSGFPTLEDWQLAYAPPSSSG